MTTLLPDHFIQRLQSIIPASAWSQVLDSFQQEKPIAFRINTLKTTVEAAIQALSTSQFTITAIPWNPIGFTIPFQERAQLTHHPLFLQGHFYIQSLASQLPPLILAPQCNEEILDLTAAPGSKTTQIAALMENTGRLAAVEMAKDRFFKLKANGTLQGATNIQFYLKDGTRVGKACPQRFDRVLLDAPCSSEGRFSLKDPDSFSYWSFKKIKAMQKKQWGLLQSAFEALKPNGRLVYSTCTFTPEENEQMIQRLLEKYPGKITIEPIDIALPENNKMPGLTTYLDQSFDPMLQNTLRVLPDNIMDGFYIACLKKN